jgi:hypothetical protein
MTPTATGLAQKQETVKRFALVCLVGILTSTFFSLSVYPRIETNQHAVLDPDGFGALGQGLWKSGSLSYYPDTEVTVNRGPFYPALIGLMLALSGGAHPVSVQLLQALLLGLTCGAVFIIVRRMGNPRAALVAGLLTAVHPFLIWYTSRIWVETTATFLFTALLALALSLAMRPSMPKAAAVGLCLGIGALTKGSFLTFAVAVPLLLGIWLKPRLSLVHCVAIPLVAAAVVLPWTIRNWRVTGEIIPVHVNAGFAMLLGDTFIDHYAATGSRLQTLHEQGVRTIEDQVGPRSERKGLRWQKELSEDRACAEQARARYARNPAFLLRKTLLNAWLFWSLGETSTKSIAIVALQVPLCLLSLVAAFMLGARTGFRSAAFLPVLLAALYYGQHLPVIACGRYSVMLTPVMLAVTCAEFLFRKKQAPPTAAEP